MLLAIKLKKRKRTNGSRSGEAEQHKEKKERESARLVEYDYNQVDMDMMGGWRIQKAAEEENRKKVRSQFDGQTLSSLSTPRSAGADGLCFAGTAGEREPPGQDAFLVSC